MFCDNDAVVDTINHKKPKDLFMLSLLREFLYVAVNSNFVPIVRKIGTKENILADHISRRHDTATAEKMFREGGLISMVKVEMSDLSFELTAPW